MSEHSQDIDEHPKGPSAVVVQRVIAVIALGVAFLVLGSVFAPADTEAAPGRDGHKATEHLPGHEHESGGHDTTDPGPPIDAWGDVTLSSVDPHEDLPVVGTLEGTTYRVVIYGGEAGPRYTVYELGATDPAAILLDEKALTRLFPDLPQPSVAGTGTTQLMYVDSDDSMRH